MDINSLQGATAYTNVPNTTPQVDKTVLPSQKPEASTADPNTENTTNGLNAFEVNITQEAQDRLAAETNKDQTNIQTTIPGDQDNLNTKPAHETNRIVNIVA